jgi:putative phosphoesterase
MRIGVVSDTHNHLANVARIVELFNASGVERVIHTGDITQAKTLHAFSALRAPLHGVFGNNDLERPALEAACAERSFSFTDPPLYLEWHSRRIVVVHDPKHLDDDLLRANDIALHGHDHWYSNRRQDGALVFNPGECAGHVQGHNAVGVLDLGCLEAERLHF